MNQGENVPRKIIVHHSSRTVDTPQFGPIDVFHKEQGFRRSSLGYFVGYHYFIEKNGIIVQARKEEEIGQHSITQNRTSIGICLAGNFDEAMPTEKQIQALGALLIKLVQKHHIEESAILPHRAHRGTHCYGLLLSDGWAQEVYSAAKG